MMTTAIVIGPRSFADYNRLTEKMDQMHAKYRLTKIIHNGDGVETHSKGLGSLIHFWAMKNGIETEIDRVQRERHRMARKERNTRWAETIKGGVVISFKSRNDEHYFSAYAKERGLLVEEV